MMRFAWFLVSLPLSGCLLLDHAQGSGGEGGSGTAPSTAIVGSGAANATVGVTVSAGVGGLPPCDDFEGIQGLCKLGTVGDNDGNHQVAGSMVASDNAVHFVARWPEDKNHTPQDVDTTDCDRADIFSVSTQHQPGLALEPRVMFLRTTVDDDNPPKADPSLRAVLGASADDSRLVVSFAGTFGYYDVEANGPPTPRNEFPSVPLGFEFDPGSKPPYIAVDSPAPGLVTVAVFGSYVIKIPADETARGLWIGLRPMGGGNKDLVLGVNNSTNDKGRVCQIARLTGNRDLTSSDCSPVFTTVPTVFDANASTIFVRRKADASTINEPGGIFSVRRDTLQVGPEKPVRGDGPIALAAGRVWAAEFAGATGNEVRDSLQCFDLNLERCSQGVSHDTFRRIASLAVSPTSPNSVYMLVDVGGPVLNEMGPPSQLTLFRYTPP
jgi:hypothetical protein